MFYLTTHSTHFIYGYMASDIWLRTILIVRRNPQPPHRLLFPISSKSSFRIDRIAHTTAFVTPVVEHWLEREIASNFVNAQNIVVIKLTEFYWFCWTFLLFMCIHHM